MAQRWAEDVPAQAPLPLARISFSALLRAVTVFFERVEMLKNDGVRRGWRAVPDVFSAVREHSEKGVKIGRGKVCVKEKMSYLCNCYPESNLFCLRNNTNDY